MIAKLEPEEAAVKRSRIKGLWAMPWMLEPEVAIARTQLIGRLLLPTVYLYHAMVLLSNLTDDSFSMFLVNAVVLVGLVLGCALVAAGLKSRAVALALAVVNLGFVCYHHPFFRYVWREKGEWRSGGTRGAWRAAPRPHLPGLVWLLGLRPAPTHPPERRLSRSEACGGASSPPRAGPSRR